MKQQINNTIAPRMLSDYCRKRVAPHLPPNDVEALRSYILRLHADRKRPPRAGRGFNWTAISEEACIEFSRIFAIRSVVKPALEALIRCLPSETAKHDASHKRRERQRAAPQRADPAARSERRLSGIDPDVGDDPDEVDPAPSEQTVQRRKRGSKPLKIVSSPEAVWDQWDEPATFHEALDLHMRRHRDSSLHLFRAVVKPGETMDKKTIITWRRGSRSPRTVESLEVLSRIERRYRLPEGYFKAKLPHPARSAVGHKLIEIGPAERRRIAWHLPDDFDRRSLSEQEAILEWVRTVIVAGSTEFRRFQAAAVKQRYAIRFPGIEPARMSRGGRNRRKDDDEEVDDQGIHDPELLSVAVDAPRRLADEMADLISFKTSTLTTAGLQRNGVWGEETALQKIEHLGLLFGALAASPRGGVEGFGVPLSRLTFGMLVVPAVWDWYVQWRERRRGFFTAWEVDMLRLSLGLTRADTGWLRQRPDLASRLAPVPGLVSTAEIAAIRRDWAASCDRYHKHASARVKEVQRVARVHRDPFEPILPILEADSPVGEYRKITAEILRLMPDERRYPRSAAEAVRSLLMLRFGLHLGLRQKNLRQLLLCPRGHIPASERKLAEQKRGELRWSDRDQGWEVFIPAIAFKNADSSYFGNKPFRLVLPDLDRLYQFIDDYVDRHRSTLLRGATDPGTFFIKTVKTTSKNAAYDQTTFYEAWRLITQRYAIFNPYTGRGAIKGLLPHGPHNVRDVLATHILKKTGSYEQASYAIQDTPDMVAKHYGRFLPQDKAALAAQILNKVWEVA